MRLKWLGARKNRVLELPVPFLSKSEKEGELHFDPECEVPNEWAEKILELYPDGFARVDAPLVDESVAAPDKAVAVEASTEKRKPGRPKREAVAV